MPTGGRSASTRALRIAAKLTLAVVAGLSIGGVAFAVARPDVVLQIRDAASLGDRQLLNGIPATSQTGTHITMTDSLQPITQTVRIDAADLSMPIDATTFTCHGGRARISWNVGNLEPTISETGITLTARFDGNPIGSILRGSTRGVFNDAPVGVQGVVDCSAGTHVVDLFVTAITGQWGIPYVNGIDDPPATDYHVNRGFVIEEIW